MTTETVAQLIKRERQAAKLSLRQLAEKSGINHHAIHRIERGTSIKLEQYKALCKALGIRINIL